MLTIEQREALELPKIYVPEHSPDWRAHHALALLHETSVSDAWECYIIEWAHDLAYQLNGPASWDGDYKRQIGPEELDRKQAEWDAEEKPPEEIRVALESALKGIDGVLVLHNRAVEVRAAAMYKRRQEFEKRERRYYR